MHLKILSIDTSFFFIIFFNYPISNGIPYEFRFVTTIKSLNKVRIWKQKCSISFQKI